MAAESSTMPKYNPQKPVVRRTLVAGLPTTEDDDGDTLGMIIAIEL